MLDFNKIKEVAQGYQADMTAFLRAIVKNPGESCDEKAHVETIAAEMKKLDFDEVVIDPQATSSVTWVQVTRSSLSTVISIQ